jgi:hypothetical protein
MNPIGWASVQTNNYGYVGGDPVRSRDPSGLTQCDIDVGIDVIKDNFPDLDLGYIPSAVDYIPHQPEISGGKRRFMVGPTMPITSSIWTRGC